MFRDAVISALFGALGPFFNKQATLDPRSRVYSLFTDNNIAWAIHPFNLLCIMLTMNTVSVKHKMLSYKNDGAFLGTSLIFSLGYLFSALLDIALGQSYMNWEKYIGVLSIIVGLMLITASGKGIPKEPGKKSGSNVPEVSLSEKKDENEPPKVDGEEKKVDELALKTQGRDSEAGMPGEWAECEVKVSERESNTSVGLPGPNPHLTKAQRAIEEQIFFDTRNL